MSTTTTINRRWALWAGLGTAAVAVLVIAVSTASGAAPPAQVQRDIDVFVGQDFLHKVDEEPLGDNAHDLSPGDTLLHHDPVLHPDSGEQIGSAVTRVRAVRNLDGGDVVFLLDCTVRLPDGNLVFYGAEQLSNVQAETTYAVTGGTGDYAGIQGTVAGTLSRVDGQDGFLLAFDFTRP